MTTENIVNIYLEKMCLKFIQSHKGKNPFEINNFNKLGIIILWWKENKKTNKRNIIFNKVDFVVEKKILKIFI